MDLSDLRARARRLSGVDMTDLFSDSDVDVEINEAMFNLLESRDWRFLDVSTTFPTVADQRSYSLPAAVTRIHGLEIVSGSDRGDLRPRSESDMSERIPSTYADDTGAPIEYVFNRPDTIDLYPLPDKVYTITVEGRAPYVELALDTDEPVFGSEFHRILAYAAAIQILDQEGDDSGRAERYAQIVSGIVRSMVDHYQIDHDRAPMQMGGRRDSMRRMRYVRPYRWV